MTKNVTMGAPLPGTYGVLEAKKAKFRRGATSMIAGPPGAFKSVFALNIVTDWALKGMAGLFISADSDEFTVAKRCAGILTGDNLEDIEKTIRKGAYEKTLTRIGDIHFEFESCDLKKIAQRILAFEVMYGKNPDFIVLDNLMNMVESPDDHSGQIRMTRDLDTMARKVGCHAMILHHTREGDSSDVNPQPVWAVQGKVNQFPRQILTLNCGPGGRERSLNVAVVKNTNGPATRDGSDFDTFVVDTQCCQVNEPAYL